MKKNRIALIIILILGVLAMFLVWKNQSSTTLDDAANDFVVADTATVTKIFLANLDTNQVLLERTGNSWKLNKKYKAQQQKVDQILATMLRLRVRNPVSVASHNNVITRMSSIGVKVEVYQMVYRIDLFGLIKLFPHEKRTKVYYVGDVTKDNLGTYMLSEGSDRAYVMYLPGFRGFVMARYTPVEDDWRDHTVFRATLSEIQSVKVEFNEEPYMGFLLETTAKNSYKLTRVADNYPVHTYDTLRVLNLLTSFNDVRFEALLSNTLPPARIDSIIHSPFLHRITLVTVDGDTNVVTTFRKKLQLDYRLENTVEADWDNDRMYGLINNNRDFVLLQYYTFDKLLYPVIYYEKGGPDMRNR